MTASVDGEWLRRLPKAEVHVHLEGCIPWDLLEQVATRRGVESPKPRDGVRTLPELLQFLDRACPLLAERQDLVELAYRAGERSFASGTQWTDFIVNPTHWRSWHGRIPQMVDALDEGFAAAEADGFGGFALCLSLKRTQSQAEALAFVNLLLDLGHPRVVALSIDGNEAAEGRTGERFAPAFQRAAEGGLHRCVHAGESSGPEGVRDAMDLLLAERIDHGIRAIEDRDLVAELARRQMPLDICPHSNLQTGLFSTLSAHPINRLRLAGVPVSLNTDDPVVFEVDLWGEYWRAAEAFSWTHRELREIARTSVQSSFAPEAVKQRLLAEQAGLPDPL